MFCVVGLLAQAFQMGNLKYIIHIVYKWAILPSVYRFFSMMSTGRLMVNVNTLPFVVPLPLF